MNLTTTLEHRFDRTPDGAVWTQTAYAYDFFWTHYLAVFDHVRALARVRDVRTVADNFQRADGARVSFVALPYYIGPKQYLRVFHKVRGLAQDAVGPNDAVIMRVPSQIASNLETELRKSGHPYGLQVVGDPYDVFAPGGVKHPLRRFFRWQFTRTLRRHCAQASAVAYVTREALQRQYPCPNYSVDFSDVKIPKAARVTSARTPCTEKQPATLITVGTLEQLYKGPDVLIEAVGICVRQGLDLRLVIVGDGKYRDELETKVAFLGLGGHVRFLGQLSAGVEVRAQLDQADLFVLPSKTEGLPRAMIEAMARALPCIGSTVGGIPELARSEDLFPPGDASALALKIRAVVTNPERMALMSTYSLEKSGEYLEEKLQQRRLEYYQYVKNMTEEWIQTRGTNANSAAR
jgi:glycosyltransferase involved in cell wall biosynthesis